MEEKKKLVLVPKRMAENRGGCATCGNQGKLKWRIISARIFRIVNDALFVVRQRARTSTTARPLRKMEKCQIALFDYYLLDDELGYKLTALSG